jgi:hypothetical protein
MALIKPSTIKSEIRVILQRTRDACAALKSYREGGKFAFRVTKREVKKTVAYEADGVLIKNTVDRLRSTTN